MAVQRWIVILSKAKNFEPKGRSFTAFRMASLTLRHVLVAQIPASAQNDDLPIKVPVVSASPTGHRQTRGNRTFCANQCGWKEKAVTKQALDESTVVRQVFLHKPLI
ncbi:hypothetical protein LP417_30250 [Polaromonas sp. P1-6]|nr:hypothetical protein LP417_30250 [Polaromonas sp. P1-6]UUZ68224.1 hypothetical protein LP416_28910 [Polaromonas sp. P2-4]